MTFIDVSNTMCTILLPCVTTSIWICLNHFSQNRIMFFTNAFQNYSFTIYFIKLIATSFHQNASPGGSLKEHRLKLANIKHVFQNNAYVLCRYNTPV